MRLSEFPRMLWIATTFGFLLSFLSVVLSIVLAINDSAYEMALSTHFLVWICGTAIILIAMLWRSRTKSQKT